MTLDTKILAALTRSAKGDLAQRILTAKEERHEGTAGLVHAGPIPRPLKKPVTSTPWKICCVSRVTAKGSLTSSDS